MFQFFVEMSTDLRDAPQLRRRIQSDTLLPPSIRLGEADGSGSIFDALIERYVALCERTEDIIIRHITLEVENDLKQHLTRYELCILPTHVELTNGTIRSRWDPTTPNDREPDASLLNAMTSFSTQLVELKQTLPNLVTSRLYRRVVLHLSNHIQNRAVYSGWSKFTAIGGREFANEVNDWRQVSSSTIPDSMVSVGPWTRLCDISRVLSLPGDGDDVTFSQAMAAAWSDGDESLRSISERIGLVDLTRIELQGVLRRRIECWR